MVLVKFVVKIRRERKKTAMQTLDIGFFDLSHLKTWLLEQNIVFSDCDDVSISQSFFCNFSIIQISSIGTV